MRKKLYILSSALVILLLSSVMVRTLYAAMDRMPVREYTKEAVINSVWDWENVREKSPSDVNDTALFLYQRQINTVFLDISGILAKDADTDKLDNSFESYIRIMGKRKINVYAAAGDTDWSKPEQRWQAERVMDYVYDFNKRHPDTKFAGIELDIEAYNQEGFAAATMVEKSRVLTEFMDMVDKLAARHQKADPSLQLGFAIPYWFDNQNQNIRSIEWQGKTGPILYHVADRLNQLPHTNLVVMAYRNASRGTDGTIAHSRTEIDYARYKAPNVKIIIGQEVTEVEPAKITFHGMTMVEFSREVKLLAEEFQSTGVYGGIAINDLKDFREFQ